MASKSVRIAGTTDALTGLVTVTLKVPGTFMGIDPTVSNFQGRMPLLLSFFFGNPTPGDVCTDLRVQDTDLLLQAALGSNAAAVALFPSYPVIRSAADLAASSGNRGFYIPPTEPFKIPSDLKYKMLPSGFYLAGDFAKATIGIDTIYVNALWDDLT